MAMLTSQRAPAGEEININMYWCVIGHWRQHCAEM